MTVLRACLMQVRALRGDWDSAPVVASDPEDLAASGTCKLFSSEEPLNLPDPLRRKGVDFSNPAVCIPG